MKDDSNLIQSYVRRRYFVSTALRWASTDIPMKYYETIVWEWSQDTRKRGKLLETADSGCDERGAMEGHIDICKAYAEKHDEPTIPDREGG